VDITFTGAGVFAAVANSGENSVSIFQLTLGTSAATLRPATTVAGIPAPSGVAFCEQGLSGSARLLVTSLSDNSVNVVQASQGTILGTIKVGTQPNSVTCRPVGPVFRGVVSNFGDSSLTLIDIDSFSVIGTVPNVPGSRWWRGVGVVQDTSSTPARNLAWVAGTDANVVTIVDLATLRVLAQVPVRQPTAVRTVGLTAYVASAVDGTVTGYDALTPKLNAGPFPAANAQDFVISDLGLFSTSGGSNSVAVSRLAPGQTTASVPGIPGAAGLAVYPPVPSSDSTAPRGQAKVVVTSPDSNSVFLIQQQPAFPRDFGAANGASFTTGQIAVGSLASVFAQTRVTQNFFATTVPLPRTLGGTTLSVGGTLNFTAATGWTYLPTGSIQAPLLFVGPSQINFQIPPRDQLG